MADFYARMQSIATNLLTRFNQGQIYLVQTPPGNGPISNPGKGTPVKTLLKGSASSAYSVQGGYKSFAPGTVIKEGDIKIVSKIIAGIEPTAADKIELDGKSFTIIKFNKVPATGTTVAWVFFVRQ